MLHIKKSKNTTKIITGITLTLAILTLTVIIGPKATEQTSGEVLSNKKIGWGIKRANNHEQPDLGSKNIKMLKENNGIAIGNKESKKIYLTFDEGYEAGYTTQILQTLKEENVKATFFITAHYVNTQPELVGKMIEEGHIIRKPHCKT